MCLKIQLFHVDRYRINKFDILLIGFKVKFQMNIGEKNYLAGNQSSLDDLFYLEAYQKETANESFEYWEDIHLKVISESQPEYRFV